MLKDKNEISLTKKLFKSKPYIVEIQFVDLVGYSPEKKLKKSKIFHEEAVSLFEKYFEDCNHKKNFSFETDPYNFCLKNGHKVKIACLIETQDLCEKVCYLPGDNNVYKAVALENELLRVLVFDAKCDDQKVLKKLCQLKSEKIKWLSFKFDIQEDPKQKLEKDIDFISDDMADDFKIYLSQKDPKLANKATLNKENLDSTDETKAKKSQKDDSVDVKKDIKEEKIETSEQLIDVDESKVNKSRKNEHTIIKQEIKKEKLDILNEFKSKPKTDEKQSLKKVPTKPDVTVKVEPKIQIEQKVVKPVYKEIVKDEFKSHDDQMFFNSIFEPPISQTKEIKKKKSKKLYSQHEDGFNDSGEETKPKKEKNCSPKNVCNSSASLSNSHSTNESVSIFEDSKNISNRIRSDEESNDSDGIVCLTQGKPKKTKDFNIVDRDPQKDLEISKILKLSSLKSEQIEYMIFSDMNYFVNIFAGKCEHSWRHSEYKKNTHQSSKLLCMNSATGGYSHDQYMTATYALRSVFCKSGNKYDDYLVKVLLPEALIKMCMRIHQCSKDDAEEFLQKCNTRNAVEFSEFRKQKNVLKDFTID